MSKKKLPPGIKPRGNRWRIDTYYKGVRLRESFATIEMAEENLRKMQSLIDEGRYLDKKKESTVTFAELRDRYLAWCHGERQKTIDDKEDHLAAIVEHFDSETPVTRIAKADVEEYKTSLGSLNANRKSTLLKPASINRRMATLKHLFSKANEWEIIRENPAGGIKPLKENNRRLRYLSTEEIQALLDACPTPTLRQLITLALHTGMRRGELLNLKWQFVHLKEAYLELEDQKNGETGENATVPLNATVLEVLRSIPRRLDSEYLFTGRIPGQPFFDLKGQFEKAVKTAGLQGVTFHTLRHSAASHMVMAGVDLATVREILRHKKIETTLRYAHLSPGHKAAAVEALQKRLTAPEAGQKTA